MIARLAFPLISAGLLLAPGAWAQPVAEVPMESAPPEVTTALRTRVNEFFQYHVDGGSALRKAMDLVAEDTKDEYFATGKMKVEKFAITDIQYTPEFNIAKVTLDVTREWNFNAQPDPEFITLPMPTFWKIEEGEWRWFKEKGMESITPMGVSNLATMGKTELLRQNPDGTINLPADFNKEETLLSQAELILKQSGVDKNGVTLTRDKASEDTVVFRNGYGSVGLELYGLPDVPGLSADLEKTSLNGEDGVLHIRYDPPSAEVLAANPHRRLPDSFSLRLVVVPFNQTFNIRVTMRGENAAAQ